MASPDDEPEIENSTIFTDWTDEVVFPEYRAEKIVVKIFAPCILAVGTFGNIATICVMRRIKDLNSSQHAILMTLAVSDLFLVQAGMLRQVLLYHFRIDLRLWHWLVCKSYYWLTYMAGTQSAWLVTCITVQRAMSITWPHKMRAVCTLRRTWLVIGLIVVTTCITYSHFLVGMDILSESGCTFKNDEYVQFYIILTWVDMFLSSFIPSICQIVCDAILCVALFKAASAMSVAVQPASDAKAETDRNSRRKTASSVTVLCLALSLTFLILTLPLRLDVVWHSFVHLNLSPRAEAQQRLAKSAFRMLFYANSAFNFFLYCVTGTRFRKEFLNWICCWSHRHSTFGDASAGTAKGRKPNN